MRHLIRAGLLAAMLGAIVASPASAKGEHKCSFGIATVSATRSTPCALAQRIVAFYDARCGRRLVCAGTVYGADGRAGYDVDCVAMPPPLGSRVRVSCNATDGVLDATVSFEASR